jgi:hypothetical protein
MEQWTEDELRQLVEYATITKNENEELRSKMIMMQAKLNNEESKTKFLTRILLKLGYDHNKSLN